LLVDDDKNVKRDDPIFIWEVCEGPNDKWTEFCVTPRRGLEEAHQPPLPESQVAWSQTVAFRKFAGYVHVYENMEPHISFHKHHDEEFWTKAVHPIQQPSGYQNITLTAVDDWGGGRTNFKWQVVADNFGCLEIDLPGHFCDGITNLEDTILALVNARNMIAKQWPNQWLNVSRKKEWKIEEEEEHDEHKETTLAKATI